MKNILFLYFFALTFACIHAQNLSKSDFKKTDWFANNENGEFYESNTVQLIKIVKFNNDNDRLNELYIKLQKTMEKILQN